MTESGLKNRAPLRSCGSLNLVILSQAQGKLSRAKLSNQFPQVTQVTRPPGGGREGYSPCKATRQPASCHLRPGLQWLPLSSLKGGGGPGEACRVPWASRLFRPIRWAPLSAPCRRTGGPASLPPLRSPSEHQDCAVPRPSRVCACPEAGAGPLHKGLFVCSAPPASAFSPTAGRSGVAASAPRGCRGRLGGRLAQKTNPAVSRFLAT